VVKSPPPPQNTSAVVGNLNQRSISVVFVIVLCFFPKTPIGPVWFLDRFLDQTRPDQIGRTTFRISGRLEDPTVTSVVLFLFPLSRRRLNRFNPRHKQLKILFFEKNESSFPPPPKMSSKFNVFAKNEYQNKHGTNELTIHFFFHFVSEKMKTKFLFLRRNEHSKSSRPYKRRINRLLQRP
jgi:hypothetical protein